MSIEEKRDRNQEDLEEEDTESKVKVEMKEVMESNQKEEELNKNHNLEETMIRENVSPKKQNGTLDFVQRATMFHGRKHSRRYNFKNIMEESKNNLEVQLAQ